MLEIYKHNNGTNMSGYASIRFYKTIDTDNFVNVNNIQ